MLTVVLTVHSSLSFLLSGRSPKTLDNLKSLVHIADAQAYTDAAFFFVLPLPREGVTFLLSSVTRELAS